MTVLPRSGLMARMKAVSCIHGELELVDVPEPTPARGQVRIAVTRCGICGSDLHARRGFDTWADMAETVGYDRFGRSGQPIVMGCGPVGLGVILMLKAAGVATVVAGDRGHMHHAADGLELEVGTMDRLARVPGWWHAWNLAERTGTLPKRPVIFECVGVPGLIDEITCGAPLFSRIVVVGVCVGRDEFQPAMAINRELELRFVFAYTPPEFRQTLHMLADGKVDPRPMLTGTVGLAGVEAAFDALSGTDGPTAHAKVLVDPRSAVTTL